MAALPLGAVARYRVCTEKSLLGVGAYADIPVGDILKYDPDYIAWAYYNLEKISFKEDILTQLNITERIAKPGVDKNKYYTWKDAKYADMTEEQRRNYRFAKWRVKRATALHALCDAQRATRHSKAELQAANHGHIKLNY